MLTYIINAFNEVVIKMNISIDGRGINWYKGTGIGTYTEKVLTNMIGKTTEDSFNIYWSGDDYLKFKKHNTNIILTSKNIVNFLSKPIFHMTLITLTLIYIIYHKMV